jgi:hypothetical protein
MGNAKAQHEVARRYLLAQGLSQSLTEAYAWYNVSSATFEKELTDLYGGTRFFTFWPFSVFDASQRSYMRIMIIGIVLIVLMIRRPQGIFGKREEMVLE